jgi:hypothetical protein
MLTRLVAGMSLSLISVALGQTHSPQLPCPYSGDLLRSANGKILYYTPREMKARATHKVDMDDSSSNGT